MKAILLFALCLASAQSWAAEVILHFDEVTGPVKPVNGVGQPPMNGAPTKFSMMRYLKDAGIPYARLHDVGGPYGQLRYVDIPNVFRDFDANENDPKSYSFAYTDALMKALDENGVEPFYRLGVTIDNPVNDGYPGYFIDPPKDFAKWARICEHVIRHYTEGWADGFRMKATHWEIWNEPDNEQDPKVNPLWRAPFSDYIRFYGTVAPYLKSRFPHLKIGGYGSCGFYAGVGAGHVKGAHSSPRMEYFIECATNFLSAVRTNGWPLDFFSFHSYSKPAEALRQVRYADELLTSYGFPFDRTERIFNEWLPYVSHGNLGTALQAAGIAAELIGLQNGPCDLACVYDAKCGIGNYSALFNPMTYRPHKAYYAFTAFNELRKRGRAIRAEVIGAEALHVAAAVGADGTAAVMLANDGDAPVSVRCEPSGWELVEVKLTDGSRTEAYPEDLETMPPHSFAIATLRRSSSLSARPIVVGIPDACFTNTLAGVRVDYADAVYAAGAVPYVLPETTNGLVIAALLDRVDMLLFCGGEDVDPARYGERPAPRLGTVNARRDAWEWRLLDEATRRRLPILGICRGCQLVNAYFGGTLWQDLPSEFEGSPQHRLAGEHPIAVEGDSYLARLVGGKTSVNSRHHQAVKRVADGFRVTARSPEGVVEAIEGMRYPAIGVQFHPESMFGAHGVKDYLPLFRGGFAESVGKVEKSVFSSTKKLVVIPDYCATNRYVVMKPNMAAALEQAGFVSVVVPFTEDDVQLEAAMAGADALMVAGGIGGLQDYSRRCAFERRMIALALKRGIPICGVCHGSQVINVHFGGTLKDTPQKAGATDFLIAHRMPVTVPYVDNFHLADLIPGSRIATVFGSTRAVINSSHSMRSFEMGKDLRVTARAPDGVVEAFEHRTLPVMAFQFHPERVTYDRRFVELLREALSPSGDGQETVWLSAADAPVFDGAVKDDSRAADGTSWFVSELVNEGEVRFAKWTTAGLGVYEVYVNGARVGGDFLKPGFTHNKKTKYSFAYDVTAFLKKGKGAKNILAAEVSSGWWRDKICTPSNKGGGFVGRKSAFRGVLDVTFSDGTTRRYGTNTKTWKAGTAGPVTHAAIFDGEEYDARICPAYECHEKLGVAEENREFNGELLPTRGAEVCLRRDHAMKPVAAYVWKGVTGAEGTNFLGTVVKTRTFKSNDKMPIAVGETLVVDFGQNAAAVPEFRFRAKMGTVLTVRPAEMLNDGNGSAARGCDGPEGSVYRVNLRAGYENSRLATYTFAGADVETYLPRFTFFGYRYLSVTATAPVEIESVVSVPVSSIRKDMELGSIETGVPTLNRFIQNVYWGQLSNYLSVPTDCPQRNERLGWTADTQVFCEAASFNANVYDFLCKWMRDERDSQHPSGGFPSVAPFAQYGNESMRVGWADAGVIVPYTMWKQFGDTRIVRENFAAMERYLTHVDETKYAFDAIRDECLNGQYADWLSFEDYEPCNGTAYEKGPDGNRRPRPDAVRYWEYLGACYWLMDARMLSEMAMSIGNEAATRKWAASAEKALSYIRENFVDPKDGLLISKFRHLQGAALFALHCGVLADAKAIAATKSAYRKNLVDNGGCNRTGFLGTSILMDTLTENGMVDIAYDLLLNHKFPSWLYSVDQGATTVWERWNSYTKEKGFGPVGMNSFNHYAYGAVLAWIYKTAAGIAADPKNPGFKNIIMAPKPDRRLGYVTAEYKSAAGLIKSAWRYEGGKWIWKFTVPEGATADVFLPGEGSSKRYVAGNYEVRQ